MVADRSSKAPSGLVTEEEFDFWRPPVVVVIVIGVLLFIAFITWQIYRMPTH